MFNLGAKRLLPDEAIAQLRSMLDTYDRLRGDFEPPGNKTDQEIEKIRTTLAKKPETLWWTDLYQAQLCVISLLGDEELRPRISDWRRRLYEVAGEKRYDQYLTSACDLTSKTVTVQQLRADLSECIRMVFYLYGSYGVAARSRSYVTVSLFRVALGIILFEAFLVFLLTLHGRNGFVLAMSPDARSLLAWMFAASSAAVVGSMVSVQRRLQDPAVDVDPFFRDIQTRGDWFGIAFVSPLFGAIFGIIAYFLLLSGFISSSLVQLNPDTHLPKGIGAQAALLTIGFAAGFAEQLIPDTLTRIAARALGSVASSEPQLPLKPAAPPVPTQ